MKILIVNTSERVGGAAVASNRLVAALNNNGEKARMLVRDKQTTDINIAQLGNQRLMRWRFLWERFRVFLHLHLKKDHLWEIDIANIGADITTTREFRESDVIHLAWINQGMLSLANIRRILKSGKPVVWTMHDLWPATALCHYARGCEKFKTECGECPLLPRGIGGFDLAASRWRRKLHTYSQGKIRFVTCSHWLEEQAKQSGLLREHSVTSIPNPIDTNVFCTKDKLQAKRAARLPIDKKVILFVSQKVTDERKGAPFLVEALKKIKKEKTELARETVVALLGGNSDELATQIPLPVFPLGYISGDNNLAAIYNAADVFVLPSMEDNLPNTLMEALACGVPCVGFNVGGIPEMIDHKENGYVAESGNAADLAEGLAWTLSNANTAQLSHSARTKVIHSYSQQAVANKYIEVYNSF